MDLAAWVHEPVKMEVCSFKKYYLTDDPTQRCTFSMLAANLIGRSVKWGANNTGGWNEAYLNAYLNSRVYAALPIQIRSIIKKVSVISTAGNKSKELIPANCYIAIPAYNEVENVGSDPYIGEGETIPYMINVNSAPGENVRKRADSNGVYKSYWLRSPDANYSYVWTVNQDGDPYGYSDPSSLHNILIMLSF
jgi:hypothetical protein